MSGNITLVRPSDPVMWPYHFSLRRLTVVGDTRTVLHTNMLYNGCSHMLIVDSVFVGYAIILRNHVDSLQKAVLQSTNKTRLKRVDSPV